MSCGRLSRASDAWRARFDAAHKRVNAFFVQPLSTRRLCQVTRPALRMDQDQAQNQEGHVVMQWHPIAEGERVQLGPTTSGCPFLVDHLPGAVGWRIESAGIALVFSGDTKFSANLPAWASVARLLIHEALSTNRDREQTYRRGHAT